MISLLDYKDRTKYAEFYATDITEMDKLPTYNNKGKDNLSTLKSVCVGSICRVGYNPTRVFTLVDENTWLEMQ